MRRFLLLTTILSLLIYPGYFANGESVQIPHDEAFYLENMLVCSNGNLILSGGIGNPMQRMPLLFETDLQGHIQWELLRDDLPDLGYYYNVIELDGGDYAALRNVMGFPSAIDIISNGCIVNQITGLRGRAYRIFRCIGGMLVFSKSNANCSFEKRDPDGNPVWYMELDENIMVMDCIEWDGAFVAVGWMENDMGSQAVILAFDDLGNVIFHYTSDTDEEYHQIVATEDNGLYIIGNAYRFNEVQNGPLATGVILNVAKNAVAWEKELPYYNNERITEGYLFAILPQTDSLLIASHISRTNHLIRMLECTFDGEVFNYWDEPTEVYHSLDVFLFEQKHERYILTNGYPSEKTYVEYLTSLKKCTPP